MLLVSVLVVGCGLLISVAAIATLRSVQTHINNRSKY